jgi:hypothetical protein
VKVAFVNQPWNPCPPPGAASIAIWTYQTARRVARQCEVLVYARQAEGQPKEETSEGIRFRRFGIGVDRKLLRLMDRLRLPGPSTTRATCSRWPGTCAGGVATWSTCTTSPSSSR